jgi:uracil phosphoribosyltransferase
MFKESDRAYIAVDNCFNRSMKSFISAYADPSMGGKQGWLHQLVDLDGSQGKLHGGVPIGSLASLSEELKTGDFHKVKNYATLTTSAEVLATQMRRADLHGPDLQRAHEEVGKFLADKMMDNFGQTMGLVCNAKFSHVQGNDFIGKAPAKSNLLILPLMRGGEPMARGVYSRFPDAIFVHFDDDDAQRNGLFADALKHLDSTTPVNIIVVDSVINSGQSIERAVVCIRQLAEMANPSLEIVVFVLAGVIQQEAADRLPPAYPRVRFLALRVSENKYVGKGGTDTGNRLFGTSHILGQSTEKP